MSFSFAFRQLHQASRRRLLRRLAILARQSEFGRQIEQNFWNEVRLPLCSSLEIIEQLLNAPENENAVRNAWIKACQGKILQGPKVRLAPATVLRPTLGRLVTAGKLYDMIFINTRSRFPSLSAVEDFVGEMMQRPRSAWDSSMESLPLGQYVSWATFNQDAPDTDPFMRLPTTVDMISDILGLRRVAHGERILKLVYRIDAIELRFPTVADAQAYTEFRPAPRGAMIQSGLTMPTKFSSGQPPEPEVVHKPVTAASLIEISEVS